MFGEEPKMLVLHAVGPKDVCAADITQDDEVEILNGDLHIASLDENAELSMEITIERNRGYVSADRNKQVGLGTLCLGGGNAVTMIIRRC